MKQIFPASILSRPKPSAPTLPSIRPRPIKLSRLALTVALLTSYVLNLFLINPVSAVDPSCPDVQFIFARGSGEPLDGPSNSAWQNTLRTELAGSSLSYDFYELGSQEISGYQYPAVAVSGSINGIGNLVGAYISGGAAFDFGASVQQGQGELKTTIRQISARCPNTKFVLGGYSQGAMLISGSLSELNPARIAYVATFGDPKLYLPEGELRRTHTSTRQPNYRQIPDACSGKNLSPYREHVPDCYAYEGILGGIRPYQPSGYAGKLGTWCNDYDIMCSSGMSLSDHTSYVSTNLYANAASVIARKLTAAFPHHVVITTDTTIATHDVAILIDSTESMAPLINHYKTEAENLAARVLASGGRVALFEYRDLNDPFLTRQHCDFSCTFEEFSEHIDSITTAGGGDVAESTLSALLTTMNSLSWQSGATKSIVLLTDAGYHPLDRDGTTLSQVVLRSLEIDPVNIYPIGPHSLKTYYQQLASQTGGRIFDSATELSLSTDGILSRPVTKLALSTYVGAIGTEFFFDASASYSLTGGALSFDWDLDGDGDFELQDAGPAVTKTYSQPFSGYIQVRVREGDSFSTMSAQLTVSAANQIALASISELSAKSLSATSAEILFRADADRVMLTLNGAPMGFLPASQRSFILGDLAGPIEIALTPFDKNGRKGISRSLTVDPAAPGRKPTATPLAPNAGFKS